MTLSHSKPVSRPGGRSARVQAAVHQAVQELQHEQGRSGLTVPAIAARAGVTPSTIYRRWQDLGQLLGDVAVEQLRPEEAPHDTGSFEGDLMAWLIPYFEEMSSTPGRAMLRDVLGTEDHTCTGKCDLFLRQQLAVINERAHSRGEPLVEIELIVETIVAPLLYRILFVNGSIEESDIKKLVQQLNQISK